VSQFGAITAGPSWVLRQRRRRLPGTPLEHLDARLRSLDPENPDRYGMTDLSARFPLADGLAAPRARTGERWVPVDEVVTLMLAADAPHLRVSPAVAAARLIGSLAYAAAGRPAVAMAVAGQVYDTGPESLLLRLDDEGLVAEAGVRSGDLVSGRSDNLTEDLTDWLATRVYATLGPLIQEIHAWTRYGVVPMWNLVTDSISGPCVTAVQQAGLGLAGQQAALARSHLLLDALTGLGAPIRRRGTAVVDGSALEVTRGSCCLYYRQTTVVDGAECPEEKCSTCPLRR